MDIYIDFVIKNWYLFAALVAILGLLIGSEVLRKIRGVISLSPTQALQLINDQDAVVLDTRDIGEYKAGHIPNARHASMDTIKNRSGELEKFKGRPVIVYCRAGNTSSSAGALLKKSGFEQVHNLTGGITAWESANLPISKK